MGGFISTIRHLTGGRRRRSTPSVWGVLQGSAAEDGGLERGERFVVSHPVRLTDRPAPSAAPAPAASRPAQPAEAEALDALRAAARERALQGEHVVRLHTPAGPGSLAEALDRLAQEGEVTAEFVDGDGGEAGIRYRPVGA